MPKKTTKKVRRNRKASRAGPPGSPSPSPSDYSDDGAISISRSEESDWYADDFYSSPTPPPDLTTPENQKQRRRKDKGRFSRNNRTLVRTGLPFSVYKRNARKSSNKKKRKGKGKKGGFKRTRTRKRKTTRKKKNLRRKRNGGSQPEGTSEFAASTGNDEPEGDSDVAVGSGFVWVERHEDQDIYMKGIVTSVEKVNDIVVNVTLDVYTPNPEEGPNERRYTKEERRYTKEEFNSLSHREKWGDNSVKEFQNSQR